MAKSRFIIGAVGAVALSMAFAATSAFAGASGRSGEEKEKSIVQVARAAGSFQTLITALEATDLLGTLTGQGHGTFTVFAPTDEAFAKLPAGTVESLLNDPAALKSILLYHVLQGEYPASRVTGMTSLPTLNGKSLAVDTVGGVKVGGANVISADIGARNGVIHVIDTVLIP
jgi:uncharacterized surface protein with fasciclin (FAS1) repeats